MLNCREIMILDGEIPAGPGSFLTGLQIRLHVLICRHCRRFARQSRLLREVLQRLCAPVAGNQIDSTIDAVYKRLEKTDEAKTD